MRMLSHCVAFGALCTSVLAQAPCSAGISPPLSIATQNPFSGTSLYGHPGFPTPPGPTFAGFSFLMDMTAVQQMDIAQIDLNLYDSGGLVDLGNGTTVVSPDQVGATVTVTLYFTPSATWVGNETQPGNWAALGTGTLTVAAAQTHSPIVFNPPVTIPVGTWGIALQVPQTTTGPNPGPLHPMLLPTSNLPAPFTGPGLTFQNLVFQRESWTNLLASAGHTQNLEIHYSGPAGYSNWTSYGTGCVAPNPPTLEMSARPVIGTTVDFRTINILPGTLFNVWVVGFAPDPAGTSLASFGLPGCDLYLQLGSALITNLSAVNGGIATLPLVIPNDVSFHGTVFYAQAAPMTSGANIGFYVSNAVCVALGLY